MKVIIVGRYIKKPIFNIDEYDYICFVNCENKHDNSPKYKCICSDQMFLKRIVKKQHQECIVYNPYRPLFELRNGDEFVPSHLLEHIRTMCPDFKKSNVGWVSTGLMAIFFFYTLKKTRSLFSGLVILI